MKVKQQQTQDKARFSIRTKQITIVLIMLFAFTSCENEIMIELLKPFGVPERGKNVSGKNLEEKLRWLAKNAVNGGNYTVTVNKGETVGSGNQLDYDGKKVSVTLTGGSVSLKDVDNFSCMFAVKPNVTLVLENITLKGRNDNHAPLIYVDGGTLIMNKGAKITGNNSDSGGGVRVQENGTFTMNDGEIFGNTAENEGGGVNIWSNGTFTMNGGNIYSNNAHNGGGVCISGGEFHLSENGKINGNNANWGGGVCASSGKFLLSGNGNINGNNANWGGGVYVIEGEFTMSGGEISGNNNAAVGGGAGVHEGGIIIMKSGKISGNTATFGGGMFVNKSGTFNMDGGEISGNTATWSGSVNGSGSGGGVFMESLGAFNLTNGKISGNNASGSYGGGVFMHDNAKFTMSGGEISGNKAVEWGGGVYANKNSVFTKSSMGGIIYGANAGTAQKNVVTNGNNHGFVMAIYIEGGYFKRRENTVDANTELSYSQSSFSGAWDN